MGFIKKVLLIALIAIAGASGLYLASSRGWLNGTPLASFHSQVNPTTIESISTTTTDQTTLLASRSTEVASQISQVLGTYIQENADATQAGTITDSALEHAKYLYCKEVVTAYENK